MIDTSPIRDELLRAREHFSRLLDDHIVYTGQDGEADDLEPGAFCRYCCEEMPDMHPDERWMNFHLKSCEVWKLQARIKAIDALLGR